MHAEVTPAAGDGGATVYRVYLPPLGSEEAARARVGELREAGITDLIMITQGEHRLGISLGVYKSRDGAERRVRDLAARGIDAQITTREVPGTAGASLTARGPFEAAAFARAFPDLEVEVVDCP